MQAARVSSVRPARKKRWEHPPVLQAALNHLGASPTRSPSEGRPRKRRPGALLALLDEQLVALLAAGRCSAAELCQGLGEGFEEAERARLWPEYDRFGSPLDLVHWRLRVLRHRGAVHQVAPALTDRFGPR